MTQPKFIAQDYGAGSGRTILGTLDDTLKLKEIRRFSNHQIHVHGHIYWNILSMFLEFKEGLSKAAQMGHRVLKGIGVDTWGVDFGLLAKNGSLLGNPFAYRDPRTNNMMEKVFSIIPRDQIYLLSGLQLMQLNTLFQLYSMVETRNPLLSISDTLLFMPDIFNYFLTGKKISEYTIASTSQLMNVRTKRWEKTIFDKLTIPFDIMPDVVEPGTVIGPVLPEILERTGISSTDVIATGCHDTASAVAAVPVKSKHWAYLSSGTWSLMGIEIKDPIITEDSLNNNFTNEGGVGNTIRFLKNVMGLWLFEGCIKTWHKQGDHSNYRDYIKQAEQSVPFRSVIDPDDIVFLNPRDMPKAIVDFCLRHQLPQPENKGEFIRIIFESLALKYRWVIEKLKEMSGSPIEVLHIVGGGCQNEMLNQFTANATGLLVIAGPVEATAAGNIMIQAISQKIVHSIQEGRDMVSRSFSLKQYDPENQTAWNDHYEKYRKFFI